MNARNRLASCRNVVILLLAAIAVLPWSAAEAQVTDCTDAAWDISADSLSILLGESTTLRWSYDGPSPPCQIRINGENLDDIYDSRIVQPRRTTTYVLSAQAPGGPHVELGSVTITVTVTGDCVTGMYGDVSANPESIELGGSSTLTWSIDGPSGCPLWINDRRVERLVNLVVQPTTRTTYIFATLRPEGGKHELDRVTVSVANDCATSTTGAIGAMPRTVHVGGAATLSWFVQRPAACQQVLRVNGQTVQAMDSKSVQPGTTTVYALTMALPDGPQTLASATVTVNSRTVHIQGNTTFWKELLVQSLSEDGLKVVLAPQVNMDLTGYDTPIYIRESVILTGNRGPRTLGPRIFTRDRPKPLFLVRCNDVGNIRGDNVRIFGFRLHGPHFEHVGGDANRERGITVNSCLNVEIANMEVAGWSGAAIRIEEDAANQRMLNPSAVNIHDNFLHHNQHQGGYGYGVDMGAGAYARIERNVFDFNRHAIAGNGEAGTGYHAENNLILKGGGLHRIVGPTRFWTHSFDVHGDRNCPSSFSSLWNCGNAGDQFWFYNNSFQYRRDNALKLRGVPRVAAYINGNIFAHSSLGSAVELFSQTRVHLGAGALRNVVNIDSYGAYGVCDFDGDGKDDLFLPTGKTWWYASAARMHWVFLKAATQRLDTVGLGDFDGDRRCDVLAAATDNKWYISKGGSGAWTALPGTYAVPFAQLRFADFNGDRITDIFRRAANGQWYVVSPGHHGWRVMQSSSFPLSELQFGDFTGDGRADVLSRAGGRWSISRSGTGAWTRINPSLNTDLKTVMIADVDGNGTDDVVRFNLTSLGGNGTWQVSWGGRTPWRSVKTVTVTAAAGHNPVVGPRIYAGQFNGSGGDDLLHVDYVRAARLYSYIGNAFGAYNRFPY